MSLTYSNVSALLERAAGGPAEPVGFHGPFWRNKTRDEFVNTSPFRGITPVVVGDSASSGIIAALSGTGPFNSSAGGIERMPPFGPYLSQEEVAAIASWIDAGCPDDTSLDEQKEGSEMPDVKSDVKLLHVKDHVKMGLLIEKLAADKNNRPDILGFEALMIADGIVDRPTDEELANGTGPYWPNGRPNSLTYIEIPDEVLMVSIPSLAAVVEGRRLAPLLSTDGSYPFAKGYDENYRDPKRKPSLTVTEWDTIYRTRLGDYTTGKCM